MGIETQVFSRSINRPEHMLLKELKDTVHDEYDIIVICLKILRDEGHGEFVDAVNALRKSWYCEEEDD